MKKQAILVVAVATTMACNNATEKVTQAKDAVVAAPAKPAAAAPVIDSATATKQYMEYMTPGEMHKLLAAQEGSWSVETTWWKDGKPDPVKSMGASENKMILGGRYIESHRTATVMGKPMEGIRIMGYDNAKKAFVSNWQDNMGTGILNMEGQYDAATKTITMKGNFETPGAGSVPVTQTFRMVDDKTQVVELYGTEPGKGDVKYWEMKLTKK